MIEGKRISLVTPEQLNLILLVWERNNEKNRGLYLADAGDRYVAIDNISGDCWTEEFKTITGAIEWLLKDYVY